VYSYPKREAITGGWTNSRKESFHFVYVHWMLLSRRELVWNVARMGKVGNTHRMLWGIKKIFTYNLDEHRSSNITCKVSLLEMAPFDRYLPSRSSRYTISTRSDSILHWVSKMYDAHCDSCGRYAYLYDTYASCRELLHGCVILNSEENFQIHQFPTGRQFTN